MKLDQELVSIVNKIIETPSDGNTFDYFTHVNKKEYSLLKESEQFPTKSYENFDKRRDAFAYRKNSAMYLINCWVKKYKTSSGCPVAYSDTLNIPFQKIEVPTDTF